MLERNEWVSLGEAASILGVHPSTVRHWADNGDLLSQRTPGGHRRFRRQDLEQWARASQEEVIPTEAKLMLQNALGHARIEIEEGPLKGQPWYERMDESARQIHRNLGRRLLMLLANYLADPEGHSQVLAEVRSLGNEYAALTTEQGLSLSDSVRAFLFFRDLLVESMLQLSDVLVVRAPVDCGARIRQLNRITDEVLLILVDAYQ